LKYVVGARGSQLSVAQTNWVISELKKANPECDYEIKTITTKGDTDTLTPDPYLQLIKKEFLKKRLTELLPKRK
jgi:porphobilinogen deaminase